MATGRAKGRPSKTKSERSQISLRFSNETIKALDELVEKQMELIEEHALFSIEVNRNVITEYLIQAEHKRMQYALENEDYPMPFILNPFNPNLYQSENKSEKSASPNTVDSDSANVLNEVSNAVEVNEDVDEMNERLEEKISTNE